LKSAHTAIYRKNRCNIVQIIQARTIHAGIVITQARIMLPPTPHLTADNLFEAPTPMMVDEMTWVVESGRPILDATSMTVAAAVSAANPWMGLN
jgi:predicted P-loop ATPase/GTPase